MWAVGQVAELPALTVVLINSAIWFFFYIGTALVASRIPYGRLNQDGPLFRTRPWEKEGEVYQEIFHVRAWKGLLPDGAALFRHGFRKKRLKSREPEYCIRFIGETCRAEALHWMLIAVSPLFFLWNAPLVAAFMVPFAILANFPCVVAQRYNRPRLSRLATRRLG
jgi:glycosyl-4,4'-diaponeurosporenoate acyltransferase